MGDDDVIEHLTAVRGIGPWSAQMFLISSLGRTDVWPTGDVGVRNGWMIATGRRSAPRPPTSSGDAGEPFRPVPLGDGLVVLAGSRHQSPT